MEGFVSTSDGISRRRVIAGMAWTAPAILVATAVPARAASGEASQALVIDAVNAYYTDQFWVPDPGGPSGEIIPVVMSQNILLNVATGDVFDPAVAPKVESFTITVISPIGNIAEPRWGLGWNGEGIHEPGYSYVSGPTLGGDGFAVLTLRWVGSMPLYGGQQPAIWIESEPNRANLDAGAATEAQHSDATTSTDTRTDVTRVVSAEIWKAIFKGAYEEPD
jgi:hypothetical protein